MQKWLRLRRQRQEIDDLTRKLMEKDDEHRKEIHENTLKLADLSQALQEGPGGADAKQHQLKKEIDRMLDQLLQSYNAKESELKADKDRYKAKVEDLMARNARLHSAHSRSREQLLALAPRGQTPQLEDVSALKAQGQVEMDEEVVNENKSLRRRLAIVENEIIQTRQEQVTVNNQFQETIQDMIRKGKLTAVEMEQLTKENEALKAANRALELGLQGGGQDAKQMLELQNQALRDITAIKDDGIQMRPGTGPANMEDIRDRHIIQELTDEKAQLMEMISRLNNDLAVAGADQMELRRVRQEKEMLVAQLDVITASDNTRQQLSAMVVQLKEKVKELESGGGDTDLRAELREFTAGKMKELEADRARLKMRCTMSEEKLKHMEEYMGSTIKQYQREIMELKRQLSQAY